MKCIYMKKSQEINQEDVKEVIPHMFKLVEDGNIDDYAHVSFPRLYFSDVLKELCGLRLKFEKNPSVSCELHTAGVIIHLEFVKNEI